MGMVKTEAGGALALSTRPLRKALRSSTLRVRASGRGGREEVKRVKLGISGTAGRSSGGGEFAGEPRMLELGVRRVPGITDLALAGEVVGVSAISAGWVGLSLAARDDLALAGTATGGS